MGESGQLALFGWLEFGQQGIFFMGSKENAAVEALKFVKSGQTVGIGTGSTASIFIQLLAKKAKEEGLRLNCIPTSTASKALAYSLGLPLLEPSEVKTIDLAVDGADWVDPRLNLIKGGGGAHLREKVVAYSARKFLVIVDDSKLVGKLSGPVPLEVLHFALPFVERELKERFGAKLELRRKPSGDVFVSENGNFIADAHFKKIPSPSRLESELGSIPGILGNGLFSRNVSAVIVGYRKKVRVLRKRK